MKLKNPFKKQSKNPEEILANPRSCEVSVLRDFTIDISEKGAVFTCPEKRIKGFLEILLEKLNSGNAGRNLIPFLDNKTTNSLNYRRVPTVIIEKKINKVRNQNRIFEYRESITDYLPEEITYTLFKREDFDKIVKDSQGHYSFYKKLLENLVTLESIPYLLQAMDSRLLVKEAEDSSLTQYLNFYEAHSDNMGNPEHFEVTEWCDYHEVSLPFAELASTKIQTVLKSESHYYPKGLQSRGKLRDLVFIYDCLKPKLIRETHNSWKDVTNEPA